VNLPMKRILVNQVGDPSIEPREKCMIRFVDANCKELIGATVSGLRQP
jgi:hypothetical protein